MAKEQVIKYTVGKSKHKVQNVVLKFEQGADYIEALDQSLSNFCPSSLEDLKNAMIGAFMEMLHNVHGDPNMTDVQIDQEMERREAQQEYMSDNMELVLEFRNNSVTMVLQGKTEGGKTKSFSVFENLKNQMISKELSS